MNIQQDLRTLYGKLNALEKAVYCIQKYIRENPGGGGDVNSVAKDKPNTVTADFTLENSGTKVTITEDGTLTVSDKKNDKINLAGEGITGSTAGVDWKIIPSITGDSFVNLPVTGKFNRTLLIGARITEAGTPIYAGEDGILVLPAMGGGDAPIKTISLNGTNIPIINENVDVKVTSTTVGLGNVNNTTDMDKPVSTEQKAYIDAAKVPLTDVYEKGNKTKATTSEAVKNFDDVTNDYTTNANGGVAGVKYWIKGREVNLDDYYNKQEVDDKISGSSGTISLGYGLTEDSDGKVRLGEEKTVQGVVFNYIPTDVTGNDKGFVLGSLGANIQESHGFKRYQGFTGLQEVEATLSLMDDSTVMDYKDDKGVNIFQNSTFADGKNRIFGHANRIFFTGEESATLGVTTQTGLIKGIHVQKDSITAPSLTIQNIDTSTVKSIVTTEWFQHQFSNVQPTVNGVKGVVVYTNDNQVKTIETTELIKRHTGINVLDKQYLLDNYSDTKFIEHEDKLIYNNNLRFFELQKIEIL